MQTIEKIIQFDEEGNAVLRLGKNFSKKEAKVVVLINEDEISEKEWLNLAMKGNAYDFLNDAAENIYTMEDGISYQKLSDEI